MRNTTSLVLLAAFITGCSPASNTTGSATSAPTLDDITVWLKIDYYPKTPKSPAYVPGQPTVIPIAQLAGVLLPSRSDVDVTKASYDYCNLSPSQWTVLRGQTQTVYLVAWSPAPDSRGDREVATVDLKTDVFGTSTCGASDFTNRLAHMESVIRKTTGKEDFSLGVGQRP
jgi:hypothetical protein